MENIATYAAHFPTNTMLAKTKACSITNRVCKEFLSFTICRDMGFSTREAIPFKEEHIDKCSMDLFYYHFLSTVKPGNINKAFISQPLLSLEFDLALPHMTSSNMITRSSPVNKTQANLAMAGSDGNDNDDTNADDTSTTEKAAVARHLNFDDTPSTNDRTCTPLKWASTPRCFRHYNTTMIITLQASCMWTPRFSEQSKHFQCPVAHTSMDFSHAQNQWQPISFLSHGQAAMLYGRMLPVNIQ